jgi:2-oxoisovalerate dehydrogenase E1 component alpha subunit
MKNVTSFTIQYQQYLNSQGEPTQVLPAFANPSKLTELYYLMTLIRIFDAKAVALQRTGKIGTYAGVLGQEAIGIAIGNVLQKEDVFCPYYRDYGTMVQRGVKMSDILSYWGGDERGNDFDNSQDFSFSVPIASQCLHAAGIASAFKIRKEKRVAVVTLGDGATSKGDFYEAINLAGAWNLPIIFVIINNQWAISVPRDLQTSTETLAQKAIAGGLTPLQVDGNDVIAVAAVMEEALEKARAGKGGTVIEAITYRLCDHTTADDARRYRSSEEMAEAWQNEPLLRLRSYLISQGAWSEEKETELKLRCSAEVEIAVLEYVNKPAQAPEAIFDYLYETLPEALKEQRAEFLEGLK